jgi:hypothetical protein
MTAPPPSEPDKQPLPVISDADPADPAAKFADPALTYQVSEGNISGSGNVNIGSGRVDYRRFRFSPVLYLRHAIRAHPVLSVLVIATGITLAVIFLH